MSITLSPEQEEIIAKVMRTGAYRTTNEVIARALEMLYAEEDWLLEQKDEIGAKIERAFEQFERGEFLTPKQLRAEMEKGKAEWRRRTKR